MAVRVADGQGMQSELIPSAEFVKVFALMAGAAIWRSPVSPPAHQTGRFGSIGRLLPQTARPSPYFGRVGVHNFPSRGLLRFHARYGPSIRSNAQSRLRRRVPIQPITPKQQTIDRFNAVASVGWASAHHTRALRAWWAEAHPTKQPIRNPTSHRFGALMILNQTTCPLPGQPSITRVGLPPTRLPQPTGRSDEHIRTRR
jgi:hypothetical protein